MTIPSVVSSPIRAGASALGLATLAAASVLGLAAVSGFLIASAAVAPGIEALQVAIASVRGLGLSRGLFRYAERLRSHRWAFAIQSDLQFRLHVLLGDRIGGLSSRRTGEWLAAWVEEVDSFRDFFLRGLQAPAAALLIAGVALPSLVFVSPAAAVVFGVQVTVALVLVPLLFGFPLGRLARREKVVRSELFARGSDAREGVDEFRMAGAWSARAGELLETGRSLDRLRFRRALIEGGRDQSLTALAVVGAFTVQGLLTSSSGKAGLGAVAAVALTVFFLSLTEIFAPLSSSLEPLRKGRDSFLALRDLEREPRDPPFSSPGFVWKREDGPPGVRLEDVSFRWEPDAPLALDRVSFRLLPGEKAVLLGPSGSGKSTLLTLLFHRQVPESGCVAWGGRPTGEWSATSFRSTVGWIMQTPWIADETVRFNLELARPGADEEEMRRALEDAGLEGLARRGLDFLLGPGGSRLSGGERQRFAFARLLLRNPLFWAVDEITAHLDARTGAEIMERLGLRARHATVLRIAHDRTLIRPDERVIFLERGRIVEDGLAGNLRKDPSSRLFGGSLDG